MSENNHEFKSIKTKPRSKKLNSKIYIVATVSVAFLLIIFFMVTRELSRPQTMELGLPKKSDDNTESLNTDSRRRITLLLDNDNKIISYRGLLESPDDKPKKISYGKDGLRKELTMAKEQILAATGDKEKGAIVIIKPSKKSSYHNLVDILDEMAVSNIATYAIVNEYTPEEIKLLDTN